MKYKVLEIFILDRNISLLVVEMEERLISSILGEWDLLKNDSHYKTIRVIQQNIPLKKAETKWQNAKVLEVGEILNKKDLDISRYKIEISKIE